MFLSRSHSKAKVEDHPALTSNRPGDPEERGQVLYSPISSPHRTVFPRLAQSLRMFPESCAHDTLYLSSQSCDPLKIVHVILLTGEEHSQTYVPWKSEGPLTRYSSREVVIWTHF